jgi:CBS domain-containing protein
MRIRDVMTPNVRTVAPATSADDAWRLMRQTGIHHLLVTRDMKLMGLVSDRDLGGAKGGCLRTGKTVLDLMSPDVVTVLPETPVAEAANVVRGRSLGCLVVAVADRVRGIVTLADLLELLGRGAARPISTPAAPTANHRVPSAKRHRSAEGCAARGRSDHRIVPTSRE